MSDTLIIACLTAGCFVLWLFLQRRKPATQRPAAITADHDWFTPPPEVGCSRGTVSPAGKLIFDKPTESVSQTYTLATSASLSPAWHNEKGWPARAAEYFPDMGPINIEKISLTVNVTATYKGQGLDDLEIVELIKEPPEVVLKTLQPSTQNRIKAVFEIGAGILERAKKGLPSEYPQIPETLSVDICMELTGKLVA